MVPRGGGCRQVKKSCEEDEELIRDEREEMAFEKLEGAGRPPFALQNVLAALPSA